jgi:hypothetical protein
VVLVVGGQAPSVLDTQARSSAVDPSIIATGLTSLNATTRAGRGPAASATA